MMSDATAVVIESIEVRRAPGIVEGFALPAFGSGINVVTGPNASGKSTTARLLHQLFWKDEFKSDSHVEVRFRYRDASWTLRRDGRLICCLRNGQAQAMPVFDELTGEMRDRYLLALHDLLRADDVAFARTIVREAAGGFDLEGAASQLGYQTRPSSPVGLKGDLEAARSRVVDARREQEGLLHREDDLARLRQGADQARAAGNRLIQLEQIKLALAAVRERDAAQFALDGLPPQLANFRGDEVEVLELLTAKEAQLRLKRNVAEQDLALSSVCLQDLDVPPQPMLDVAVTSMSSYLKSIEGAEQTASGLERDRQAAISRRDGSVQAIAGAIDPDHASQHAIDLLDEMSAAVAQLDRIAASDDAQRAVAEWVGPLETHADVDRLQAGIRELQAWLRAPDLEAHSSNAGQMNFWIVIAIIALAVEAAAIGVFLHPGGFALLILPLLLGLILLRRRSAAHVDARLDAMNRYRRLGLGEPETWNVTDIEWELAGLQRQAAVAAVQWEKEARWADLARKRGEIEEQRAGVEFEIEALQKRLGIERMFSAASITLIANALRDWRVADGQALDAAGRMSAIAEERQQLLTAFNAASAVAGIEAVADLAQATARLQQLERRAKDAADALRRQELAQRELHDHLLPALRDIEQERERLRERTGADALDEVESLFPHYEAWQDAKKRLDAAEISLSERCSQLPSGTALPEWSVERVAHECFAAQAQADRYDPLMKEINTIEEQMRQAKAGKSVEVALAAEDRARSALAQRREQDIARAIGAFVVDYVRQQSDEANLPDVARRARFRFSQITRGRYELKFVPGDTPAFIAIDTISGIEHPLDQLSSATRVQLLLAVRASFVETNERTAKLPLLLDETLANADESRAEAMIDAVFDLASDGRQIFYFTAQRDEVEKWRALGADHPETSLTIIDLAAARHIPSQVPHGRLELAQATRVEPPAPNGSSRAGYREQLGVPPINLWANGEGDLHLWYLITDLPQLHRLLCADVSTWGQVRSYDEQKAALRLGLVAENVAKIRARAELCNRIREGCRSGRGIPITIAALTESRAISDIYFNRCAQLVDECKGNASELVRRLRAREIAGFRAEKIDLLADYFREKGHIVDGKPLDPDELRHRLIIEMHPRIEQGLIDEADIDRLFDDLSITRAN